MNIPSLKSWSERQQVLAVILMAGLAIGLLVALLLSRFMEALLFGVEARDPVVFGLAPLLLGGVSVRKDRD